MDWNSCLTIGLGEGVGVALRRSGVSGYFPGLGLVEWLCRLGTCCFFLNGIPTFNGSKHNLDLVWIFFVGFDFLVLTLLTVKRNLTRQSTRWRKSCNISLHHGLVLCIEFRWFAGLLPSTVDNIFIYRII